MKSAIVVGGGVVGVLSALLLNRKFKKVYIIEKSPVVGGLLNSFTDSSGAYYDYGAHMPEITKIKEIDNLLFPKEDILEKDWTCHNNLTYENFFNGKWNYQSALPNANSLPNDVYLKGLDELFRTVNVDPNIGNLDKYLELNFGNTFKNEIFKPIIEKLQGDTKDLNKEVLSIFGLSRVIVLSDIASKELKKLPMLDSKIAYHKASDQPPANSYIYSDGIKGCGEWIDYIVKVIKEQDIEIITNRSIKQLHNNGNEITKITLDNDQSIDCNYIAWTIPTAIAYKAANLDLDASPPHFRYHSLYHYRIDQPLLKDTQFLLCFDPDYLSYRITLYHNISNNKDRKNIYNLTVEVLSDKINDDQIKKNSKTIFNELIKMNIINKNSKLLECITDNVGASFPAYSSEFKSNTEKLCLNLENKFNNLSVLGRCSGRVFFMTESLIDAYERLGK